MKNKVISKEYVEKNYISIKELKKVLDIEEYDHIDVLSHISTLMSEVDRLEDIEDRKVKIEYQLVFDKGVKSVEDKIKEKIKKENEMRYYRFLYGNNQTPLESYKFKYTEIDMNEYARMEVNRALKELLQSGQQSNQEGGQENE